MISHDMTFHEFECVDKNSSSQHVRSRSIQGMKGNNIHVCPTITLGCPTAHALKYHDGGLRRIFRMVNTDMDKLLWMHAIQSPQPIQNMIDLLKAKSNIAGQLFSLQINANTQLTSHGMAALLHRKFELSHRIDICSSQILGFAVTSIRTMCALAAEFGGFYADGLARSLRIGFYCCLQSLLSTNGDEMGMIEDLDLVSLWLSLVTFRLVICTDYSMRKENDDLCIFRDNVSHCYYFNRFILSLIIRLI
jgi:hypothetical protein